MKLEKELNLLDVFCIASGAMISSGLFILPGLAHAKAGPAVILSYLLAGLWALTGMLSQAELVSAMPKAGGTYFYVARSMGPAVATVDGLITWFSQSMKSAFALVGMAAFTSMMTDLPVHYIAVALCLVFVGINLIGVKEAGRVQVVMVGVLLAILAVYVIKGLPAIKISNFEPFAPNGAGAIISTAGFVFISYGGLLKVASVAEEVKNPGRVVPLGMILSLFVVSIFYVLVVMVTSGVLSDDILDNSLTPISEGAAAFMGPTGRVFLGIAAVMAFISTANAGIMSAARYPLALSRDELLPERLGRVSERFRTPYVALFITGAFIIGSIFLKLDVLVKAASTVLILSFLFACLSIIILRESRVQNYRPSFKAPLYPWIQIVGIIGFVYLLVELGYEALLTSGLFIMGGLFVYWFYGRIRSSREYALLHLIERVTAKELASGSLEAELKEIIRERDEIVKDRFDKVIEQSVVLDIGKSMDADEFFKLAADKISGKVAVPTEEICNLLRKRERESSTVLTPTLAIPHIIVAGTGKFCILLVRCREGIAFSGEAAGVQAVFVLVGTRDERNFHLRALAAIAQIVQESGFEKRWLSARDKEGLRDIVLLGKRRRAAASTPDA
jgi:amino acid transporter/mannitol/fructose-specific phosphotransferase system IIA component (Ntr-type)